jgi:hypothetical protein
MKTSDDKKAARKLSDQRKHRVDHVEAFIRQGTPLRVGLELLEVFIAYDAVPENSSGIKVGCRYRFAPVLPAEFC